MGEHEQANATSEDTQVANEHERYMARALELAARGAGWTNPNPQVGAVIVKDGRIIGEGWHTAYGKLHAEREVLAHCTEDPRGATIYVTLEPCCHWGKTPPCTEAIIEAASRAWWWVRLILIRSWQARASRSCARQVSRSLKMHFWMNVARSTKCSSITSKLGLAAGHR